MHARFVSKLWGFADDLFVRVACDDRGLALVEAQGQLRLGVGDMDVNLARVARLWRRALTQLPLRSARELFTSTLRLVVPWGLRCASMFLKRASALMFTGHTRYLESTFLEVPTSKDGGKSKKEKRKDREEDDKRGAEGAGNVTAQVDDSGVGPSLTPGSWCLH